MHSHNRWLNLGSKEKLEILNAIGIKMNIPSVAIEKDWWVTQTLRLIFELESAQHIVFKGGTSLSKAWGIIERFSEDIDLALDKSFLGFDKPMTNSQVSKLRKASYRYISTVFFENLKIAFTNAGFNDVNLRLATAEDSDQDPLIIEIYYPSVTNQSDYIKPRVIVEIGSRSLIEPNSQKTIVSFISENFANEKFADLPITIATVNPERTFLEKIFLLHEEFQKPFEKIRVNRLSRHLYDIEKMIGSSYMAVAFMDGILYQNIVEHRKKLTPIRGIDYANHSPEKITIVPPKNIITAWKKDYEIMQESMIYGDSLSFDNMIQRIYLLNEQINAMRF